MSSREEKQRLVIGRKIQRLREAKRMTQESFAHELNISRTHMGHIEQGRRSPSLKLLGKIATKLRVRLNDLVG